MALAMKQRNKPADLSKIESFERENGLALPSGYKSFLLEVNGGVPMDSAFPINGMPNNPIGTIQAFLGIDVDEPSDDLSVVYSTYAGGLPQGMLPIADNGGGDFVCIDLRSGGDQVVFWDKRQFWSTGEWSENDLYQIADTFEKFLTSLRPNPY